MSKPTTMRILGWSARGFRCPDHDIDCCGKDRNPYRVTLIQMPNGTGKTTTLKLLRAALSESAKTWTSEEVRGLRKKVRGSDRGCFELSLEVDKRRITIILDFDFNNGSVQYKTTRVNAKTGERHGQKEGFDPPLAMRRFMSEEFVDFYVFDGELAENLLNRRQTHAEDAVGSLFQVHLLDRINQRLGDYWNLNTKDTTATTSKGVTQRKNRLDKWRSRKSEVELQKKELEQRQAKLDKDLARLDKKYAGALAKQEDVAKQVSSAREQVELLRRKVLTKTKEVLEHMRDPHALSVKFCESMSSLKSGLDRVKLPESVAREFFEELAMESHCICDRPIDESVREKIISRRDQYLGSDDISLLNTMKASISDALASQDVPAEERLGARIAALSDLSNVQLQAARNRLDVLLSEVEQADPGLREIADQMKKMRSELEDVEKDLERIDARHDRAYVDEI